MCRLSGDPRPLNGLPQTLLVPDEADVRQDAGERYANKLREVGVDSYPHVESTDTTGAGIEVADRAGPTNRLQHLRAAIPVMVANTIATCRRYGSKFISLDNTCIHPSPPD